MYKEFLTGKYFMVKNVKFPFKVDVIVNKLTIQSPSDLHGGIPDISKDCSI